MSKKKKVIAHPYEFVLKINNNIICQRFFNVKRYNEDFRESYEVRKMMNDIVGVNEYMELGIIPQYFKDMCVENSWTLYEEPYKKNKSHDIYNTDDEFTFEVLVDKEIIAQGIFNGNLFHKSVRMGIDIRPIIPKIIRTIQKYMSKPSYTGYYGNVELVRHNKYEAIS